MVLVQSVEALSERPAYKVAVTFGHTTRHGAPVEADAIAAAVIDLKGVFNRACGGCRVISAPGSYRHDDGCEVDEDSTTVSAFGLGLDVPFEDFVRAGRRVARNLDQATVLLTVERVPGAVFFIAPNEPDSGLPRQVRR